MGFFERIDTVLNRTEVNKNDNKATREVFKKGIVKHQCSRCSTLIVMFGRCGLCHVTHAQHSGKYQLTLTKSKDAAAKGLLPTERIFAPATSF